MYDTNNFDEVEIGFYKNYLPDLVKFERSRCKNSELEELVPKVYDGNYCLENGKRGFYLIMEDLSANNYNMAKRFTFEELNQILQKIARFHSLAYAYGQQG